MKNSTDFFESFSGQENEEKTLFSTLVESISFDAELDGEEVYMVAFGYFWFFSAFILIRTVIFGKKVKFRNEQYFWFIYSMSLYL